MKYVTTILFLGLAIITRAQFSYISPMPGTTNHHRETNIILKTGSWLNRASVQQHHLVEISGSVSGKHAWTARLSDDRKTVVIKPTVPFAYHEKVTVKVNSVLRKEDGEKVTGCAFSFETRSEMTPLQRQRDLEARYHLFKEEFGYDAPPGYFGNDDRFGRGPDTATTYPLDSMPTWTISTNTNPAPGRLFFANHEDETGPIPFTNSFLTIIENDGTINWARDVGKEGRDWKINANGYLTYFIGVTEHYMMLDSNFNTIDSFTMGNGYSNATNNHDFMIYPDGHAFLIGYDNLETDMTAYGGQPDATVQYIVLQELDSNKDVVFQWRSQDPGHFQFTDANDFTSLTNSIVDYVHTNSIERDYDGNIIISNRNMDELTKIDVNTGNIIWRMNGENNQFTFVNDNNVKHFASQHDARRLANGNLLLFNNANHMIPQRSGAKEYSIDEVNKVATLVWYYEHPDVNGVKVYGSATGNAQRLPNGNTLIDWGLIPYGSQVPNHTEVDSNGNIVWEMKFDSITQKTYRIHKYEWDPCSRPTGGLTQVKKLHPTNVKLDWTPATGAVSYEVQYRQAGNKKWKTKTSTDSEKKLKGLKPDSVYVYRIRSVCANNQYSGYTAIDTFQTPVQKLLLEYPLPLAGLSLYPNPAVEQLTIAFTLEAPQQITISIYRIDGIRVREYTAALDGGAQSVQQDVSGLGRGVYLVELKTATASVQQKFIKA